jgi:hypothetical protein
MTPTEIKDEIKKLYEGNKEHLQAVQEYGAKIHGLSIEYHRQRLETLGVPFEELGLIATFSINQTPVSLERNIAELQAQNAQVGRIIHDLTSGRIYIFSK